MPRAPLPSDPNFGAGVSPSFHLIVLDDEPDADHKNDALRSMFAQVRSNNAERRTAVEAARPALARLCDAMAQQTGQSYTLRALLYSMWNGAPRSVLEVVTLDWQLQKDFCAVLMAFGFENLSDEAFFYDAVKAAISDRGIWAWFIEESEVAL
jgi:hypothetical protein